MLGMGASDFVREVSRVARRRTNLRVFAAAQALKLTDFNTFTIQSNATVEPIIGNANVNTCKSFEEWIILAGVFMLILIISLFKYKTLVPIIKPLVLKIIPWFLTNQEIDVDVASNYLTVYNTTEL